MLPASFSDCAYGKDLSVKSCLQAAANTFDGIIDTVSVKHDISQLLPLLKVTHHSHHCDVALLSMSEAYAMPKSSSRCFQCDTGHLEYLAYISDSSIS